MSSILRTLAAVTALSAATAAAAHHGFTGRYDRTTPIYLEGEVTDVFIGRPHPEFTLAVATDATPPDQLSAAASEFATGLIGWSEAFGQTVTVEFPPVSAFFDLEGLVAEGDTVAMIVLRNCDPPHQLRGMWIGSEAGLDVVRQGSRSYEVPGC